MVMKLNIKLFQFNKDILFILLIIFSSFFYLYNINFSDMWIDESFTHALVKHSFGEITELIKNDYHPPLYFYGLKIFVSVFGISVFTIRLFSVFAALSTIILGYVAGQRIFGKSGALFFCFLILSLPMLASFSHESRMYVWGAFSVTGVYLYSVLFISSNKRSDLIMLMFFSLLAAYTHYYGLLAAFWANLFISIFLLVKKNRSLKIHLMYSGSAIIFYLPWIFALLFQIKNVIRSFWVPAITWNTILSCIISPFTYKTWFPTNWPMIIIIYCLTIWVIIRNFIIRKDQQGIELGLSLFIFVLTILTTVFVSLFFQPVLYIRYIANIVIMLLIPPTLFFISVKNKWIKGIVIIVILYSGIIQSLEASDFSYGPYQQSLNYLHTKYPNTKKIFHVLELTAGPFNEYSNSDIENYWYKTDSTVVFTNMDVFTNLRTTDSLHKVLKKGEHFCVVDFINMPFNQFNLNQILSESQLIKVDTVVDNKIKYGNSLLLYMLRYKGIK
jgi:uncharacterized membrane protein